jgi:ribosomal protein S21
MATIAEVKKTGSESPAAMIRRFTKRVQATQALSKVREERYFSRKLSKLKTKRRALDGIEKRVEYTRLAKLGKTPERTNGPRR